MNNKDIKSIRRENKLNKEKPDYSARIAFFSFFLLIFIIWCFNFGKSTLTWIISSIPVKQPVVVQMSPLEEAISHTDLKTSWHVVNIDSTSNLYINLDLTNNNNQSVKNFEILCVPDYGTPTLNQLKVNFFNTVAAHSTIQLKDYNFGQLTDNVKKVQCKINDLTLNQ